MGRINRAFGVPITDFVDVQTLKNIYFPSQSTTDAIDTSSSLRTNYAATSSGSAHTPGAYVEILSSASEDIQGMYFQLAAATNSANTDTSTLMDIAIGAVGNEVNIIENYGIGCKTQLNILSFLPVYIPKGSRVSFRVRSAQTSKTVTARFTFLKSVKKTPYPNKLFTMGADTATSRGVTVTGPVSLNTKGAWTEIVSSTSMPFQGIVVSPQCAGATVISAGNALLDVAVGAAGNEVLLIRDTYMLLGVNESVDPLGPSFALRHIPAGTRLSARYQRSGTNAALDLIIYGIPY